AAFDDYGLDEVRVLVRNGTAETARTLWSAGNKPLRNLTLEAMLTESAKLPMGGAIHCIVEAKDTKGQTARTPEFVVRIASDPAAADKQLETIERTQDTFQDRLVKLIGDQKKIQQAIDKLNKEHAPLADKLAAMREETKPNEPGKPETPKKPEDKKPGS